MKQNLYPLEPVLRQLGPMAVAVSGGVDSMTLAVAAHRVLGSEAHMLHAVSPAVPEAASARVRDYAAREGWRLDVIDAREFADPDYIANPHDRCFYCKQNLYSTMAGTVEGLLVSGTNTDDLADYRPGLRAAESHAVRHPYVEAGMDKADVRALARTLALHDLAALPASPCLSSRVETGIVIDPAVLQAVDRVERLLQEKLAPETVRCRVRRDEIVIELDGASIASLAPEREGELRQRITGMLSAAGINLQISFQPYRMGSAFLRPIHEH